MLHILKFLLKPLKTEYLMILLGMKTVVMILTVCWLLLVANAIAAAAQQQQQQQQQPPQALNYKQQLQYQMQQQDKFQYQQHMKQQQQYYQQQHHMQQSPATMAIEPQQQLQQRTQQQYMAVKPTQMLQTAASLVVDDGSPPEILGQPEYSNGNSFRRRPGTRKRKRRPQTSTAEEPTGAVVSNSPPYWRAHVDDQEVLNTPYKSSLQKPQDMEEVARPSLQASFKRRKHQPAIREPYSALEKEQKLYEMRNKPEAEPISTEENANRSSINLRNILKNSGGLSLSEILQQKNLSLDDLLKGKQNALQALQTTAAVPMEKVNHAKFTSFKANYKHNTPSVRTSEELSEEVFNTKERSKLSALQKLKLFGSSSRPTGLQIGLADHLTTRKRDGVLYSSSTSTTAKPSTTKIPLYKKILHQRPTLKPTFLLKNSGVLASAETQREVTSWDSRELEEVKDQQEETAEAKNENGVDEEGEGEGEEQEEEIELSEDELEPHNEEVLEFSTELPETTSWKIETTITPTPTPTTTAISYTSTKPTTTTTTLRPFTERSTNRDLTTATRRMFISSSTRGAGRTTFRYSTSTSNPATSSSTTTSTTTTTTTAVPTTTTTTISTTTASSSTMNLTPKANLNLNTEDLRERIQETLLKNLIEKEDAYKKSPLMNMNENKNENGANDDDDDLENFFEETIKPKTTKYIETSTITTRMKQYTPSFIYSSSTSTTSSPSTVATATENANVIPDFDNVDDRTDLLELIEDRRSGNRLFKVLEQRNMTLEELIEHRKRGSSQLHLATIVESPSRFYPDKKVVLQDNMDIVTAFENFPHFNLLNLKSVKPDEIKTDSQGSSYFTSIIDIEPTDEVYKNRKGVQAVGVDLDKASLLADRSEKSLGFFPSWKTLALASLATSATHKKEAMNPYFLQQPKMLLDNNSDSNDNDDEDNYDIKDNELSLTSRSDGDSDNDNDNSDEDDYREQNPIQAAVRLPDRTAEAIENEVARAHDLVDLELSGHGFKRSPQAAGALAHSHRHGSFYTNMPPGIKSAIVASATIVLTALITFMVIFSVCKWKQRRHRMTNIMKSYNAMKSKLPTITAASTAALNAHSGTAPNSRRSSFREMQDLLGGSGLSVAATITTTSSRVPNTPIHTTKTASNLSNATQTTTLMAAGPSSKHINSIYGGSNASSSCGGGVGGLRPLQRQSSLLFQRTFNQNINASSHNNKNHNERPANMSILGGGCNLLDLKRNSKMSGSTTSLSFSLTNGHNISNSHINTMDANSPEVQEYLFDTLRNSF